MIHAETTRGILVRRLAAVLIACLVGACPLVCAAGSLECGHRGTESPGPSRHHSDGTADNCVCEGALRADDGPSLDVERAVSGSWTLPSVDGGMSGALTPQNLLALHPLAHRAGLPPAPAAFRFRC
jgi:hypothetical protein